MTSQTIGDDVLVIGAGMIGLVAAKNLLEQGLDVTVFERHEYVGGTWAISDDVTQTSALAETTANISKFVVCVLFDGCGRFAACQYQGSGEQR